VKNTDKNSLAEHAPMMQQYPLERGLKSLSSQQNLTPAV
jgi:hypothetical protein